MAQAARDALPATAGWAPQPAAAAAAGPHRPACRRRQRQQAAKRPRHATTCRRHLCCWRRQVGILSAAACHPQRRALAACALGCRPGRPRVTRPACACRWWRRGGGCQHDRCWPLPLPLPLPGGCWRSALLCCAPGCAPEPAGATPQWPALGWPAERRRCRRRCGGPGRHRLQDRALSCMRALVSCHEPARAPASRARELIGGSKWRHPRLTSGRQIGQQGRHRRPLEPLAALPSHRAQNLPVALPVQRVPRCPCELYECCRVVGCRTAAGI